MYHYVSTLYQLCINLVSRSVDYIEKMVYEKIQKRDKAIFLLYNILYAVPLIQGEIVATDADTRG